MIILSQNEAITETEPRGGASSQWPVSREEIKHQQGSIEPCH